MKWYYIIPITIVFGLFAWYILRGAIKDASDMPRTWEDLRLNRKIDREIKRMLDEQKKSKDNGYTTDN